MMQSPPHSPRNTNPLVLTGTVQPNPTLRVPPWLPFHILYSYNRINLSSADLIAVHSSPHSLYVRFRLSFLPARMHPLARDSK